jgi:hypothetical protein
MLYMLRTGGSCVTRMCNRGNLPEPWVQVGTWQIFNKWGLNGQIHDCPLDLKVYAMKVFEKDVFHLQVDSTQP